MKFEFAEDHPLYAAYRRAVLGRNDEEALKVLQTISGMNPADASVAAELARLDAKVLTARVEHLSGSLNGADPALLVAEIESIETFGFKTKPDGDVWGRAQLVRCDFLLEECAKLQTASRWSEALGKIDLIHRLQTEFKLELPQAAMTKLTAIESWARSEQGKDKTNREFQALLGELQNRITESEEKDTSSRYVELPELRNDFEAINKTWRALTDYARPIPEAAAASFRKRSDLLEGEIARRGAIRRRFIVGVGALVLAVGALIAWIVLGQMKANEFTKELEDGMAQRQVRAVDRLLERARVEKLGRADTIASGETYSTKEHALLANFEAAYNELPKQLAGEPDVARLAGLAEKREQARAALAALAPDLNRENEPRVQAFEKLWQNYLAGSSATVSALVDQWLVSAEQQAGELSYHAPVDKAAEQITALGSLLGKIGDTESGFTNQLTLRSDLLSRTAAVQAKYAACKVELKKLDDGLAAIRKARNAKELSDGISLIISSEFSLSPLAAAASAVQSLNATEESVLRGLLDATNSGTTAFAAKALGTRFVPEVVMPAEKEIFNELKTDPAVGEIHQRFRFTFDAPGNNPVEWVVAGPAFEPSMGWRKIWAWTASGQGASDTSAVFDHREYGYFDGQYKLSPLQVIYHVEAVAHPDETAAFRTLGLEKVWGGGDTYGKPLLEVMDALKNSSDGSPLFRTYLFLRLCDLMKLQPDAWGLTFCPALRAHEGQLRVIVGGQLQSGDWFLPAKSAALSPKLEQVFAAARTVSYSHQAAGLLLLHQSVLKDGLKYVGFVGPDGRPNFVDLSAAGEVFGFGTASKKPVLLAAKTDSTQPLAEPAMPLSPLFALENPRAEYLTRADVNPGDDTFKHALPPLFQGVAQPH